MNALGWGIGSEVLLTHGHLGILGFTVMIQVTNVLGARDVGYLMNGADRKKGASKKKKDELVGAGSKFSSSDP